MSCACCVRKVLATATFPEAQAQGAGRYAGTETRRG